MLEKQVIVEDINDISVHRCIYVNELNEFFGQDRRESAPTYHWVEAQKQEPSKYEVVAESLESIACVTANDVAAQRLPC